MRIHHYLAIPDPILLTYCGQWESSDFQLNLIRILPSFYFLHKSLFVICTTTCVVVCCVRCAFVVCNFCCLLQQPTMMTEIHKCQCCGYQSNSTDVKICMAPNCGNFHYLQCLKDLYSKFSLYIEFQIQMNQDRRCLHAPRSAIVKFARPTKCWMIRRSLGSMVERMVMRTQTTWTIY